MMKILVVGSGGREHALVWRLAQQHEVIAAPGNPGIEALARCFAVAVDDLEGQVALATSEAVDRLMGSKPEARFAFIQERAPKAAELLDI